VCARQVLGYSTANLCRAARAVRRDRACQAWPGAPVDGSGRLGSRATQAILMAAAREAEATDDAPFKTRPSRTGHSGGAVRSDRRINVTGHYALATASCSAGALMACDPHGMPSARGIGWCRGRARLATLGRYYGSVHRSAGTQRMPGDNACCRRRRGPRKAVPGCRGGACATPIQPAREHPLNPTLVNLAAKSRRSRAIGSMNQTWNERRTPLRSRRLRLGGIGSRGIGSRGIGSRGVGSRGIGSRGIGSRGIGSRGSVGLEVAILALPFFMLTLGAMEVG
jgi:hypothetical protein